MTTKVIMLMVIKHGVYNFERYYPVTLTKGSQHCKTKQFFKKIRYIKITGNMKIKLASSFPAGNCNFKVKNRNTRARC